MRDRGVVAGVVQHGGDVRGLIGVVLHAEDARGGLLAPGGRLVRGDERQRRAALGGASNRGAQIVDGPPHRRMVADRAHLLPVRGERGDGHEPERPSRSGQTVEQALGVGAPLGHGGLDGLEAAGHRYREPPPQGGELLFGCLQVVHAFLVR